MKLLVSPAGSEIISVRTVVEADTMIEPGTLRYEEGAVDYEIRPKADRILWETQEPRREDGKQVFTSLAGETFDEEYLHYVDPDNGINEPTPVNENLQWKHYRIDQIQWSPGYGGMNGSVQDSYTITQLLPKGLSEDAVRARLLVCLRQLSGRRVKDFAFQEVSESETAPPVPDTTNDDIGF